MTENEPYKVKEKRGGIAKAIVLALRLEKETQTTHIVTYNETTGYAAEPRDNGDI